MMDASPDLGAPVPADRGIGVSIAWVWLFVVAVWAAALVRGRSESPQSHPDPLPASGRTDDREKTAWEQVAERHGDHRTDDQIRKANWLVFAIWNRDEAAARRALAAGADPNGRSVDPCRLGYTPLMAASAEGLDGLVALLLALGAAPNLGYDGDSPLQLAIQEGHDAVVRRLVAAGARPGATRQCGGR